MANRDRFVTRPGEVEIKVPSSPRQSPEPASIEERLGAPTLAASDEAEAKKMQAENEARLDRARRDR